MSPAPQCFSLCVRNSIRHVLNGRRWSDTNTPLHTSQIRSTSRGMKIDCDYFGRVGVALPRVAKLWFCDGCRECSSGAGKAHVDLSKKLPQKFCRNSCGSETFETPLNSRLSTMSVSFRGARPKGAETPNLLIRRQPRPVRGDLSLSVECSQWTHNIGGVLRRQSKDVRCRLTPFDGVSIASFRPVVTSS